MPLETDMSLTPAQKRTAEFYAWEQRGRGWFLAPEPVELEPPFVPFYAYQTPTVHVDDGKKTTWLSSIAAAFREPREQALPEYDHTAFEPIPFAEEGELCIIRVHVPRQSRSTTDAMERALSLLAACLPPMSVEVVADSGRIVMQLAVRDQVSAFVRRQLSAHLPECVFEETAEDALFELIRSEQSLYVTDFGLAEECMRPLATHRGGGEPLLSLYAVLEHLAGEQQAAVQILFSGTVNQWKETLVESVSDNGGSFFWDAPGMPRLAAEKAARPLFAATVRLIAQDGLLEEAEVLFRQLAVPLMHAAESPFNSLISLPDETYTVPQRLYDMLMRTSRRLGMLLNSAELATLAHVPSGSVSRKLSGGFSKTAPVPASLLGHAYHLGTNTHFGSQNVATLDAAQRSRHMHVLGSSGTGKSTLLHSLLMQDINNGEGCMLLDPHGDLYEAVLHDISEEHIHRVVLIDPSDGEFPIGFNILAAHSDLEKELLASDLVALFRRFSTSWGDQMNSVFANAICAFVYNRKAGTIADLRKFLIEPLYRTEVLKTCTDPDIAYYWHKEYPLLKSTSIGPILTRLDSFLRPRVIRNMVGQTKGLDFRELMDGRKVVLVKLSQGLLGAENSYLLGALLVSKLQQTAMARQIQEAAERVPFYCYIDEFHHFVSPTLNELLAGSRKYALSLILAHQQLAQISDHDIAASLMANAGTRIVFKASDADAKRLQDSLAHFAAEDLLNLGTGEAIARVNTNEGSFNIAVDRYLGENSRSFKEEITERSRRRYGMPPKDQALPYAEPATQEPPVSPKPPPAPVQQEGEDTAAAAKRHEQREHVAHPARHQEACAGIRLSRPGGSHNARRNRAGRRAA
ncbi:type IV secretory system conjugative DNA transfer family protein [Mucilaginibacter sp. HD30]